MQENTTDVIGLATEKVNLGRQLISSLTGLVDVPGVRRVQEQISREVNHLLKAINEGSISEHVINASMLLHLECLVKILLKCRGLTSVDYVLPLDVSEADPMRVDIVCENGACNVNVEAKNLHQLSKSERILNQAEEFVEAATSNPEVPKAPQMCLIFDNELDHGQGKGGVGMDDSLLDFVNSIVRMDQATTDRPWELHLANCAIQGEVQTGHAQELDSKSRDAKRIQLPQRKAATTSDRKRTMRMDRSPVKYHKGGQQLLNEDADHPKHGELLQDGREALLGEHQSYGTPGEMTESHSSYSESQNYFCDSCKDTGLAYEQEILRLREDLKQKDHIINSLKSLIGPSAPKHLHPGGERLN